MVDIYYLTVSVFWSLGMAWLCPLLNGLSQRCNPCVCPQSTVSAEVRLGMDHFQPHSVVVDSIQFLLTVPRGHPWLCPIFRRLSKCLLHNNSSHLLGIDICQALCLALCYFFAFSLTLKVVLFSPFYREGNWGYENFITWSGLLSS